MEENKTKEENKIQNQYLYKNTWICIFNFILFIAAVFLDQYVKIIVRKTLPDNTKVLIPDVLELKYLENAGAAFGMLQGQKIIFLILTIIIFMAVLFILFKLPNDYKFIKLNITLVFLLAGALGNAIDRVYKATVTDFIYFKLINFPIFNIADIYISISTIFLVILLIFVYKEEDLAFLDKKKNKNK